MIRVKQIWRLAFITALLGGAVAVGCVTKDTDEDDDSSNNNNGTGGRDDGGGGAAPTAGSTSTGGAAGSSSVEPMCDAKVVADGSAPLITDFEEATEAFDYGVDPFNITSEGVLAGTYGYGDDSVTDENMVFELVPGPDSDTALSFSLIDTVEWGGGFGFWINGCIDATVYSGISFWIRGNTPGGTTKFFVHTGETRPEADRGTCVQAVEGDCVAPSIELELTDDWTEHRIAWSDLTDGTSSGNPAPTSGDNIVGLEWGLAGNYDEAETLVLAIDDVAFFSE